MRVTIKKILSLAIEGACCSLLIIDGTIRILLDCGINHTFDFSSYKEHEAEIKLVQLALISHSSLEYSGAFPFLISELGLNPSIFYTTQPIMRYSPLNLHEEVLNFRHPSYGKKIFNCIYSYYQDIQLIKPHQKKAIHISDGGEDTNKIGSMGSFTNMEFEGAADQPVADAGEISLFKTSAKVIIFSCFGAGGSLGSLAWRINYGLINIVYLVQYTNYALGHIDGLDLEALRLQPTSILITDSYASNLDEISTRPPLHEKLKDVLLGFYRGCGLDPQKPRSLGGETDRKLLITCYPSEMLVEIMLTLKKVISQLQETGNREKIGVVHLSSRFLQLIKSQIEYLSDEFKTHLQRLEDFFVLSKSLMFRINIASIHSLNGILSQSCNPQNVSIFHLGHRLNNQAMHSTHHLGYNNLKAFRFLSSDQFSTSYHPLPSLREISIMPPQSISAMKSAPSEVKFELVKSESEVKLEGQDQKADQPLEARNQPLAGKYISQIGFPHFMYSSREEIVQFDIYGLRHRHNRGNRPPVRTINDVVMAVQSEGTKTPAKEKKSTIEVMNIEFKLPELRQTSFDYGVINYFSGEVHRTDFSSSVQIIRILKPNALVFINLPPKDPEKSFQRYKSEIGNNSIGQRSGYANASELEVHSSLQSRRIISNGPQLFDLASKRVVHIEQDNELLEYRVNYIPLAANQRIQRIVGVLQSNRNQVQIHLQCIDENQVLEFRLEQFYKKAASKCKCYFTGRKIIVDGVAVYRSGNQIVLEGVYSEEFFKVRRMLYDFLKIRKDPTQALKNDTQQAKPK